MCAKDYDGFGADLLCDFAADFLEFGVGWVAGVFHDVWATVCDRKNTGVRVIFAGRGVFEMGFVIASSELGLA